MTIDNMTGITKGSYTGFCKSQLITCNRVKECNGVCPFEDALKHADKTQTMNEQHIINHDRDWIIGCIQHDGFIHTHRGDKANQIILDALSAEAGQRETNKEIAERIIDITCKNRVFCELYPDACQKEKCDIYLIINTFLNTPDIDTQSRQRGEWVEKGRNEDGTHNIVCDKCGAGYKTRGHARSINTKRKYRFCPSCGARMYKGGEKE